MRSCLKKNLLVYKLVFAESCMLLPMAKLSGFADFGWAMYTFPTKKRPGHNAFPPPKILVWRISKTVCATLLCTANIGITTLYWCDDDIGI